MLVLTRKAGEKVRIAGNILVTVVEAQPGQIKLGIHAPRDVPVYREELYERIQAENRSALLSGENTQSILEKLKVTSEERR